MMIGIGIAIVLSLKRVLDDGSPYVLTDYVAVDYVQEAP